MVTTIICPKVTKSLRDIVDKICAFTGIVNYDLKDPISHNINKYFQLVITLGNVKFDPKNCGCLIDLELPSNDMPVHKKQAIGVGFQSAADYIKSNDDPKVLKNRDLPPILDLEEYLKKRCGSTIILKLEDNRMMCVYPDGEKFEGKYELEMHYSALVNMHRIISTFKDQVKEIIIQEE